eukprot:TRINITY_DN2333_c0_g1_i1.p1 TRINITY_DN2333_c0_g1~~TRINITY_DN2333_c0_g1_i1.p1  ORF type:complete len:171 (+),score=35.25 TRINITY_DN2333_c0_g1_i1:176-688(+)
MSDKCEHCAKTVYHAEKREHDGKKFHARWKQWYQRRVREGNWLNGYLWTREPGPCFVITGERKEVQQDEESHYKKELFEAKELLMHIHHSLREALEDLSLSLNQPKLSVDGTHVAQLHERESSDSEIEEFENFEYVCSQIEMIFPFSMKYTRKLPIPLTRWKFFSTYEIY